MEGDVDITDGGWPKLRPVKNTDTVRMAAAIILFLMATLPWF
jgi:hypothetical protein